jgi:hypothetical protein
MCLSKNIRFWHKRREKVKLFSDYFCHDFKLGAEVLKLLKRTTQKVFSDYHCIILYLVSNIPYT